MHEQVDKNDILLTLAEKLPEELIQDIFPNTDPDTVRDVLHSLIKPQAGGTEKKIAGQHPEAEPKQIRLPFSTIDKVICTLYTDGASRGNPGEAGAGIVLLDEKGRELATLSKYLGQCTNNSAEYQALIAGLETALETGCSFVHVFLDSELIVRQIEGRYKVKNEQLKPLFAKVKSLLARFTSWQVDHVPRTQNARADQLANKGIDDRVK